MKYHTAGELAEIVRGICSGNEKIEIRSVSTDSRNIGKDALFIALQGARFDGHDFLQSAYEHGAKAALIHRETAVPDGMTVIRTADTLLALGDLARDSADLPGRLLKVAITGSVGKTSTKDMTARVLSARYRTMKTPLNYNNEIGLPMTCLQITDQEALVAEMGMRGLGQIAYLTKIVCPDIGMITNIGISHIELLGSRENILRAKLEICLGIRREGTLLLNGDDPFLADEPRIRALLAEYGRTDLRIIYYGTSACCDVRAENIENLDKGIRFDINYNGVQVPFTLQLMGRHHVYNAAAAAAAGICCGIPLKKAAGALEDYGSDVSRQQCISLAGLMLIDDTYNAGPESMKAALSVLGEMKADVRVAVLGDMLELGELAEQAHYDVGAYAAETGVDLLVPVGVLARGYQKGYTESNEATVTDYILSAENAESAVDIVISALRDITARHSAAVLVKGSHAMRMDLIAKAIAREFAKS